MNELGINNYIHNNVSSSVSAEYLLLLLSGSDRLIFVLIQSSFLGANTNSQKFVNIYCLRPI